MPGFMLSEKETRLTQASGRYVVSRIKFAMALLACGLVIGCGGPPGGGIESPDAKRKLVCEAYSFNARLLRDGRPTTFKLEVYQTDTLLGLSGTGYLGKGALRGQITADSLLVYFPHSKEYIEESIASALNMSDCPFPLTGQDLIDLFQGLPEVQRLPGGLHVSDQSTSDKRRTFLMYAEGCPWQIEIMYDKRKTGWRIKRFELTDGGRTGLRAIRQRHKTGAKVKFKRFQTNVPPEAFRITP